MKTLVIVVHPNFEQSRCNKALINAIDSANVTKHFLYSEYPDFKIDVKKEQELLMKHDRIVLQFPMYWYSSPALLKEWLDKVLEYGWAFGGQHYALEGKELMVSITTGGPVEGYKDPFTIEQLLRPFEGSAHYIKMKYLPHFVVHGCLGISDGDLASAANKYKAILG